jgi:histidinol phosphatase-like enzyme (inositol monophosphatase family)
MSPRLQFAVEAAYRAGRGTLALFGQRRFDRKADDSPVTRADRDAEASIRAAIEAAYPGEAVLGEEQGGGGSGDRWVIDPIDGTKSFISGVPLYATLLAYEIAGEPVLGVCYFPALDEMLYAEVGKGAFHNGRRCRVSEVDTLADAVLCVGGLTSVNARERLSSIISLGRKALAIRGWGDAYGHALVATGRAEAMLDPSVKRWDVSAMAVIVREAGGRLTDLCGRDALADEALSTNRALHEEVLRSLDQ